MTDWQDDDGADIQGGDSSLDIAVIGMVGRVPGAPNVEKFWENLRDGVESITFFGAEEMIARGLDPSALQNPNFVPAMARIPDIEMFDAGFFGFSPREADQMDPQHRLFLEGAWEVLENAGYDSERYPGLVGVFGGVSHNMYLLFNLLQSDADLSNVLQLTMGNDKDFVATRASYKLDLKGPSVNVQTGCSTALVLVHMACQSLLAYQCDMALAGTVCLQLPHLIGYNYHPGGVLSSDGHCRAFSAKADGAIAGSGVTFVALKRLADALADGDTIHAVIKGSAINNDGASKIGFTAPSIEGQARVVDMAQAAAGVEPRSITYVEAHGSATPIGDPIEFAALSRAFRARTQDRGFCALGTVKTNVGHLDTSAGLAGMIKTVLSLKNRQIPPMLHFDEPNPEIDLESSPFYITTKLIDWPAGDTPRRAGVSSFGIGGTNAHVILEEAPEPEPSSPSRPFDIVLLSARIQKALDRATDNLVEHLARHPEQELSDVTWTLQHGRRRFGYRRALVCPNRENAREALAARDPRRLLEGYEEAQDRSVAFLLPGLGDHYAGMASGIYRDEAVFRREVDRCAEVLRPILGLDLRQLLFAAGADQPGEEMGPDLRRLLGRNPQAADEAAQALSRTALAQPAMFVVEYALAMLWQSWGVRPAALCGYSLGEYVAATLAGVFSLEDALFLVAERARILDALPPGSLLAVPLSEKDVQPFLQGRKLSVSAVNGAGLTVVGGPAEEVAELERELTGKGFAVRPVQTTHAFHTWMMEPAAGRLTELVARVKRNAPTVPYLSNVTGTWITPQEAADPAYWAAHLCQPVRMEACLSELWRDPARALIEVGPGQSLGSLALQHPAAPSGGDSAVVLPSLRHAWDRQPDSAFLLSSLAKLWLAGGRIDWAGFHGGAKRRRVALPTYPFEKQRHWVDPIRGAHLASHQVMETSSSPVLPESGGTAVQVTMPASSGARRHMHARPSLRTPFVAPSSELERTVAGLWERLLGIEGLGVHDNFFELGGHSLLGTQLANLVRDVLGIEFPLRLLFEAPTIAGMAAAVADARAGAQGGGRVAPGVVPVPRTGDLPLSFAQSRMWFLNQFDPLSPVYNIPFAVRLLGSLSPSALEAGVTEIVRRHESLRTTFPAVEGKPVQAIAEPPARFPVPRFDLSALPEDLREPELERLGTFNARTGFDLVNGPLLRMALVRVAPEEHVLLLNMHHIVSDGWSIGVFLGEIAALYEDFRLGRPVSLPPLPVQYADFAAWQSEWLQGEVLDQHLDYWRQHLAGHPPSLDLPLDRPRGERVSPASSGTAVEIAGDTLARFRGTVEREGVTPFILLLTALNAALSRHSHQDDVLIGTAIANRTRAEIAPLIGFFVNTLVLRTDLSGDPTFAELLGRVREVSLGAFANQDLPFEKLVEELQPERDLAITPFFQVLFTFQNTPAPEIDLPGLALRGVQSTTATAQFDLVFTAVEGPAGIYFGCEYRTELFDGETVERLLGHTRELLAAGLEDPGRRLSDLPLLTGAERAQLLAEWEATPAQGTAQPVHRWFEAQAARRPDALAVTARGVRLTYGELNRRANQLARRLRAMDVRPEAPVAVLLERSPEMLVALLGAWKAGASYLPLDPAYPQDRLAFMVADSGAHVTITRDGLRDRLPSSGAILSLDMERDVLAALDGENLPDAMPFDPRSLAYLIYTSGSTGVPKGVAVPQGGLLTLLDWHHAELGLREDDRATLLAGPAFDASVLEIWPALTAGASLHVPEDEVRMAPPRLMRWLGYEKISFSFLPTPLAEAVLEEEVPASFSLRILITGGDKLHRAPKPGLPFRLYNLYGPTENSVVSTAHAVVPQGVESAGSPPIGKALPRHRSAVVDRNRELVALGVHGELCVGGPGLARGYHGRPDLTAEAFVPDPFSAVPGERLYRTGDLVRRRADHEIEFLGRVDQQVKIRGYRIEVGEVEAAVAAHPGLRSCAVVARPDHRGETRLVAYVVPVVPPGLPQAELRRYFRMRLPEAMVPSAFVNLPDLPVTANGKLDRDNLPEPVWGETEKTYVAPSTPVEEELARIWAEVLGLAQVGAQDNFFDLGGHSLLAAQCIARIRESLGVELPLQSLFEAGTLADLADRIVQIELEQVDEDSLREMLDGMNEDELRALLEGEQELELEGGGEGR